MRQRRARIQRDVHDRLLGLRSTRLSSLRHADRRLQDLLDLDVRLARSRLVRPADAFIVLVSPCFASFSVTSTSAVS